MDWIRVEVTLPDHPKVGRLARRLKVDRDRALAIVVRLLCWTAAAKEDGFLNGTEAEDIAEVCRYHGDPDALVEALIGAGWLDGDNDGLSIHQWMDRQGSLFRARERAAASRERRAEACGTVPQRPRDRTGQDSTRTPPNPPSRGGTPARLRNLQDATVVQSFDDARAALRSDPSNRKAQETFDRLAAEIARRGLK